MACRLRLPRGHNSVHDVFHICNLGKCLADPTLHMPMNEIQVDKKLNFVEKPVEILDRETKRLKNKHHTIVKVRWSARRETEFICEQEDHMRSK